MADDVPVLIDSGAFRPLIGELVAQWLSGKPCEPLVIDRAGDSGLLVSRGYHKARVSHAEARRIMGGLAFRTFESRYVKTGLIQSDENGEFRVVDLLKLKGAVNEPGGNF